MAINAASAGVTQHRRQARCVLLISRRVSLQRVNLLRVNPRRSNYQDILGIESRTKGSDGEPPPKKCKACSQLATRPTPNCGSPLPLFSLSFLSPSALLSLCFHTPFAPFWLSVRSPFTVLSLPLRSLIALLPLPLLLLFFRFRSPLRTCARPSAVYKS
jgi:hypothetical protein